MDAETRAQLDRNALAQALASTPGFFSRHGTKILIALCVLLLIVMLVQRRSRAAADQASTQVVYLSQARDGVGAMTRLPNVIADDADGANRVAILTDTEAAINVLLDEGDDIAKAEGLRLRGDLYRQLARQPKLSDTSQEPAQYGEYAVQAYQAAIEEAADGKGVRGQQRVEARLGLAAALEDTGDLDAAKKQYAAIGDDPSAAGYQKVIATQRTKMLDQVVGYRELPAPHPVPEPTTQPTTQPTTRASAQPGDGDDAAGQPAMEISPDKPATRPATAPAGESE